MSLIVGILCIIASQRAVPRNPEVPYLNVRNVRLDTDSLIVLTYKKQEFAAPRYLDSCCFYPHLTITIPALTSIT